MRGDFTSLFDSIARIIPELLQPGPGGVGATQRADSCSYPAPSAEGYKTGRTFHHSFDAPYILYSLLRRMLGIHIKHFVRQSKCSFFKFPNFCSRLWLMDACGGLKTLSCNDIVV